MRDGSEGDKTGRRETTRVELQLANGRNARRSFVAGRVDSQLELLQRTGTDVLQGRQLDHVEGGIGRLLEMQPC